MASQFQPISTPCHQNVQDYYYIDEEMIIVPLGGIIILQLKLSIFPSDSTKICVGFGLEPIMTCWILLLDGWLAR